MTWDAGTSYLPRLAEAHLAAILTAQPVAVVMGARQCGKSTMVESSPITSSFTLLTLDDIDTRSQAHADPEGLVERADRLIIDEVQRAPDLVIAIKRAVDRSRRPGRFVLTGSANLLAMRSVRETLAGRASYLTLGPMTRRERLGLGTAGCWDEILDTEPARWPDLFATQSAPEDDWRLLARNSAYPPVAVASLTEEQQADWLQGYVDAFVSRDVAELAQISRPLDLLRMMRTACASVGQVEHQANWAAATGLPTSTVSRWVDLLETAWQIRRVPAFSVNRTSRLTKKPKLYWSDTAMALHLAGLPEPGGQHFENLVLADLHAWCNSRSRRPVVHHWRTVGHKEVDFIIEQPSGQVLAVEVKATARPGFGDTEGLRSFLAEYPDIALGGLLIHGGNETTRITRDIVAVPWWQVL